MFRHRSYGILGAIVASIAFGLSVSLAQAATIPITISSNGFIPANVKVVAGDTLEFRNSTTATQSARTAVASGFNTGDIGASQTKSVVVSSVGTYSYSSAYNAAFTGSVEVAAAASGSSTSTASTTLTSQPVQTQPQPVSGVFEVVAGMTITGMLMVIAGGFWQRRLAQVPLEANESILTVVPRITLQRDDEV